MDYMAEIKYSNDKIERSMHETLREARLAVISECTDGGAVAGHVVNADGDVVFKNY